MRRNPMKNNDAIFFVIPIVLGIVVLLATFFLAFHMNSCQDSFFTEAKREMHSNMQVYVKFISHLVESHELEKIPEIFRKEGPDVSAFIILDEKNQVVARSENIPGLMKQHLEKPNIKDILQGKAKEGVVVRYSQSLSAWLIYHTEHFEVKGKQYVLEVATAFHAYSYLLSLARTRIFAACLIGLCIVTILVFYMRLQVSSPLAKLRSSVADVASGNLDFPIFVPARSNRFVRDIAISVESMADRLKTQISQLEDSRNELNAIFDTMTDGVILICEKGLFECCNSAASKILGIPKTDKQQPISEIQSPEFKRLVDVMVPLLSRNSPDFQEFTYRTPFGEVFLLLHSVSFTRNSAHCLLTTISDITHLKKLEGYRTEFLANVSHEIKTPLTGIISAVESLEDGAAENPDYAKKCFRILSHQGQRLRNLLQDVLTLASLERSNTLERKKFIAIELDEVVRSAVEACLSEAKAAGVVLNLAEEMPHEKMKGDFLLLEQAVSNLIVNAVRHSGSPSVDIRFTIENGHPVLRVVDYGRGIAPEHLGRIFERFYRAQPSVNSENRGSGLGLAIVKHIVQLHGGTVSSSSEVGHGSVFTIVFPPGKTV